MLQRFIAGRRRVFVLTGAGCSTSSGIPDYRDENGEWKRRPPVMFQAFRTQPATYRRYWARAYAGWPRFIAAAPGTAHHALAAWERAGTISCLVTQNVDRLHQRAGSRAVIDLHGRLDEVVCLDCGARTSRASLQFTMAAANPGWNPGGSQEKQENRRQPMDSPELVSLLPSVSGTAPDRNAGGPQEKLENRRQPMDSPELVSLLPSVSGTAPDRNAGGPQEKQENRRQPMDSPELVSLLPSVTGAAHAAPAPDGDADVEGAAIDAFVAPHCERCGGQLKPDVVFFGENVPAHRVDEAREALAQSDALVVAGSSLMVYSGFRFVRFARDLGLPIAIVNRGRTRGDELADVRIEGEVGAVLSEAVLSTVPQQ